MLGMSFHNTLSIHAARASIIARVLALAIVTHFSGFAVLVTGTSGFLRSDATEITANAVPSTVRVHRTELLLTANSLVVWVAEEPVRTCAEGAMVVGLAYGVAAANHGACASVAAFSLTKPGQSVGTCFVGFTVVVGPTFFGQYTNTTSAFVEVRALVVLGTFWHALLRYANLVF